MTFEIIKVKAANFFFLFLNVIFNAVTLKLSLPVSPKENV